MARKDSLKRMKLILVKRRDALRKALAGDLSLLKELSRQSSGDVVDFALDSAHDEISSQLAEVESREGKYGLCEACNDAIPMARLNALPYATLCIKCQREMERTGADSRYEGDWGRVNEPDAGEDMSINDIEIDAS